MPGEESFSNSDEGLDYLSSSDPHIEIDEEEAEPAKPVLSHHCVVQISGQPMKVSSFTDLHTMVLYIREASTQPGFRVLVFEGNRMMTTRFPAPHLITPEGDRIPLFDTRIAYTADDDGSIGPPVAEVRETIDREPDPFRSKSRP